jgi:hypothetical protein
LLPGCHVVDLERRVTAPPYSRFRTVQWTGYVPATTYALRMKPGARYVIRQEIFADGYRGRLVQTAREETTGGEATELFPAKGGDDVMACKDWERTAVAR